MSKRLEGKTAIVTGGARGIGRAISVKLASEGANVVICDLVINEAAEETIKLIEEQGVKAAAFPANVTVAEDCENLFKLLEAKLTHLCGPLIIRTLYNLVAQQ